MWPTGGMRLKDEALNFRTATGILLSFHIYFLKDLSPVYALRCSQRDELGLDVGWPWKTELCAMTVMKSVAS